MPANLARKKILKKRQGCASDREERPKGSLPCLLLLPTTPLLPLPFLRGAPRSQRQSLYLTISSPDSSLHARCCFLEVTFSFSERALCFLHSQLAFTIALTWLGTCVHLTCFNRGTHAKVILSSVLRANMNLFSPAN